MNEIKICPNCGSKEISFLFTARDWHYGNKDTYNESQCKKCGLVFLNPMYTDEEAAQFYPEASYYAYHQSYEIPPSGNKFRKFIKHLIFYDKWNDRQKKYKPAGKILDIGCGNGWDLYQYKKHGWEVAGVEPSKVAAAAGNEQGLNIFNGTLLEASYPANEFDFIYSNHSFEHIPNPNEVLDEMYRILKPGGKLLIGVPNFSGLNAKIAKKYWYYLGAPVHPFNYSSGNLKQIMEKHGFKVRKVKHVASVNGINGSWQIYLNRHNGKTSHEGAVANSRVLRFISGYAARLQNLLRIGDCIEITATK